MKTLIVILSLILIVMGMGCEPIGPGDEYQYLGTMDNIHYNCDAQGEYTTTIVVNSNSYTVAGKIDITDRTRRLRRRLFVWKSEAVLKIRDGYGNHVTHRLIHKERKLK